MTPSFFLLCLGLGALAAALAGMPSRPHRTGTLAICAMVVLAGVLTIPLVIGSSLGSEQWAAATRAAMRWLYPASTFICGGAIWLALRSGSLTTDANALQNRRLIATALCLHIAAWFITFDIGKIAHDAEMRQFFAASHLPLWSMYLVLAAEILGSIALCTTRWRTAACCWLAVVMIGAIGTHLCNGDPLSDSIDAVRMLVLLGCAYVLVWRGRRAT